MLASPSGAVLRSLQLSFAQDRLHPWRVPIIAAWSSRIERSSGTTLRIGRRLQLGFGAYPPTPGVLERGTRGALI
jgi:hypothetical protein